MQESRGWIVPSMGSVQQCVAATRGSHLSHIKAPKRLDSVFWTSAENSHLPDSRPSHGNIDVLCMLFCSCIVQLIKVTDRTSLTHIYHDASSLLLVIISHAMAIFIQTAGKLCLVCLTLWSLLLWCNPSGELTIIPNVASDRHQPSPGHRPIKGHFTSFLLVFSTTTTRVALSLEARPIPCIYMLEEEEACSPFVTCISIPGCWKLVSMDWV